MSTDQDRENPVLRAVQLAETRAERLQLIVDRFDVYEEGMPDPTVPGAAKVVTTHRGKLLREHPRYVLVTQYGDHGHYRLRLGSDLANVQQLAVDAAVNAYGSELVICYFDLDVMAGPEPSPEEGDKVRLTAEGATYGSIRDETRRTDIDFYVVGSETDTFDGVAYKKLYLSVNQDADYLDGDYDAMLDEQYVEIVKLGYPDERLPVCYDVVAVLTNVIFNTRPTENA